MAINIIGGGGGGISVELDPTALKSANNLSDVPNKPTARNNLGLGTIAVHSAGTYQVTPAGAYSLPFPFQSQFPHALLNGNWVPIVPNDETLYIDYSTSYGIDNSYSYYGYDSTGQYVELLSGNAQVGNADVTVYRADGNYTGNTDSSLETVYLLGTGPTYGSGWGDSPVASADEYDSGGAPIGYIFVFLDGQGGFSYEQNANNPPY